MATGNKSLPKKQKLALAKAAGVPQSGPGISQNKILTLMDKVLKAEREKSREPAAESGAAATGVVAVPGPELAESAKGWRLRHFWGWEWRWYNGQVEEVSDRA